MSGLVSMYSRKALSARVAARSSSCRRQRRVRRAIRRRTSSPETWSVNRSYFWSELVDRFQLRPSSRGRLSNWWPLPLPACFGHFWRRSSNRGFWSWSSCRSCSISFVNEGRLDPKSSLTCSAGVVMLRPVRDEIRLHADAIQKTRLVVSTTGMRV